MSAKRTVAALCLASLAGLPPRFEVVPAPDDEWSWVLQFGTQLADHTFASYAEAEVLAQRLNDILGR